MDRLEAVLKGIEVRFPHSPPRGYMLITKYSHQCDRCKKVVEHRDVTLPKDWLRVQLGGTQSDLCSECSEIVKEALESI